MIITFLSFGIHFCMIVIHVSFGIYFWHDLHTYPSVFLSIKYRILSILIEFELRNFYHNGSSGMAG